MLHVLTCDLAAFQRLYNDTLPALPGVMRLTSTLVMKSIVQNRPIPLDLLSTRQHLLIFGYRFVTCLNVGFPVVSHTL